MIEIAYLVDYLETIPALTRWFRTQWPEYYAERTQADIAQDFHAEANRDGLPIRLIAFADGNLAGTISLRERALRGLLEYQPGLGGLFVLQRYRSQGIGTELVKAGMNLAKGQGFARVYTSTVTASGILKNLGWKLVRTVSHNDEQLEIYSYELDNFSPTQ